MSDGHATTTSAANPIELIELKMAWFRFAMWANERRWQG